MKRNLFFVIALFGITILTSCKKEDGVISGPSQKIMDLVEGHVITEIDSTTREFIRLMDECRAKYSQIPVRYDARLQDIIIPGKPVDGYYILKDGAKWYPHVNSWEKTMESPEEFFSRVDTRMTANPDYKGYRDITGMYPHKDQRYLSFDIYFVDFKPCQSSCQSGMIKCQFYEMIFLPECYMND